MSKHCIYKIECLINRKVYIGQTKNKRKRWDEHKYQLRRGIHHSTHLQRVWTKYGESNFCFSVIEECEVDRVDERERYWISFYDSTNKLKGFNLESGGGSCKELSEETKAKIGRKNAVHYARTSKFVNSESSIIKRSLSNTGKKRTKEFRVKMSEIAKNRTGDKNPFYGKTHSAETKLKISSAKMKPNPKRYRSLTATNPKTGEILNFRSRLEAERHGFGRGSISKVLKGEREQYKGFFWKEG